MPTFRPQLCPLCLLLSEHHPEWLCKLSLHWLAVLAIPPSHLLNFFWSSWSWLERWAPCKNIPNCFFLQKSLSVCVCRRMHTRTQTHTLTHIHAFSLALSSYSPASYTFIRCWVWSAFIGKSCVLCNYLQNRTYLGAEIPVFSTTLFILVVWLSTQNILDSEKTDWANHKSISLDFLWLTGHVFQFQFFFPDAWMNFISLPQRATYALWIRHPGCTCGFSVLIYRDIKGAALAFDCQSYFI